MGFIHSRDGTAIAYQVRGQGAPLVLVHGTGSDHSWWDGVAPLLAETFRVITPDRRGRGASGDAATYQLEREFADVAALVEAIPDPVNLLGHSFGGLCALEAALFTSRLRRMILYEPPIPVDSSPVVDPLWVERMRLCLQNGDPEGALLVYLADISAVPVEEIDILRRADSWRDKVALAGTILREVDGLNKAYRFSPPRFKQMSVPTLLMVGSESIPRRRKAIEILNASLPSARVFMLAGQGHVAMNTAPALFAQEVIRFLLD